MVRWLVAAISVVALLSTHAAAFTRPSTATWHQSVRLRQSVVEQQTVGGATQPDPALWVTNPTGCVWDTDDYDWFTFSGVIEAGQSVSVTACLVGDWQPHLAWARSDTAGLRVTVSVSQTSVAGRAAAVLGPDYDNGSPRLPMVEGSNGGVGIIHEMTITVTNTTGKRIRRAYAVGHLDPSYLTPPCALGARFGFDPAWAICQAAS